MQQPTDQRKDVPGQYLDIALVPRQYLDIALVAGQYKIYCPAMSFDPPMQSVTFSNILSSYGHVKKTRPVKAGSHYLHYQLNNLGTETNPSQVVT